MLYNAWYNCGNDLYCSAAVRGEISTIPLTKLLERDHPRLTWVAILIQVFIMVSISVSYLTIGTALHHTCKEIFIALIIVDLSTYLWQLCNSSIFCVEQTWSIPKRHTVQRLVEVNKTSHHHRSSFLIAHKTYSWEIMLVICSCFTRVKEPLWQLQVIGYIVSKDKLPFYVPGGV